MPKNAKVSGRLTGPCPSAVAERAAGLLLALLFGLPAAVGGCGNSSVGSKDGGGVDAAPDGADDSAPAPDSLDAAPPDDVDDDTPAVSGDAGPDVPDDTPAGADLLMDAPAGELACNAVIQQHPDPLGAAHVPSCSAVTYSTNPPSSGDHYPEWPAFRTYDKPVPAGYLVHGLEHGAVIISYNCADGCAAEVARAQTLIDAQPLDVACAMRKRIILVPDPMLTVRFAAAAWTWTLRADCFDEAVFGGFINDHYDHAPEHVCVGGADKSVVGWCP